MKTHCVVIIKDALENSFKNHNLNLNQLNISIRFALKQDSDEAETRDGMDISICIINHTTKVLKYEYDPIGTVINLIRIP
jgi:hypothetical protein